MKRGGIKEFVKYTVSVLIFLIVFLAYNEKTFAYTYKNEKSENINYTLGFKDGRQFSFSNGDGTYLCDSSGYSDDVFLINLAVSINGSYSGNVEYKQHVNYYGWQNKVSNGAWTDVIRQDYGIPLWIEAISMKLRGDVSNYYYLSYDAYACPARWSYAVNTWGEHRADGDASTMYFDGYRAGMWNRWINGRECNGNPNYTGSDDAAKYELGNWTGTYGYWLALSGFKAEIVKFPCTVSIDTDGGSFETDSVTGAADGTLIFDNVPTKNGSVFDGWEFSYEFYGDYDSSVRNQKPASNITPTISRNGSQTTIYMGNAKKITLKAKWRANSPYAVGFDANGGSGTMDRQLFINGQDIQIQKNAFTRPGYTFKGWSTTPDGAVQYADQQTVSNIYNAGNTVYGGVDYIAVYNYKYYADNNPDVKAAFGYNQDALLSHFVSSGMSEGRVASPEFDINYYRTNYGDLTNAWSDKRQYYLHYINNGQSEGRKGSGSGASMILYAQWERKTYRIGYDANGGDGSQNFQTALYMEDVKLEKNRFERDGYTFKGWSLTPDGEVQYTDGQTVNNLYNNNGNTVYNGCDYYPVFDYEYYKNAYADLDGSEDVLLSHFVNWGMSEGRIASPEFNVHIYKNNYADLESAFGNDYKRYYLHYISNGRNEGRIANKTGGSITLYAVWEQDESLNTYTLHFDPNDGKIKSPIDDITLTYDSDVILPDATDKFVKYTLDGEDITEEVLNGTITLNADGYVENAQAETEPTAEKRAYASVFRGWSLEANRDDFEPQWKAGSVSVNDIVNSAGMEQTDGATITLYAIWDDCPWIVAQHLYYSLEQAQSGYITEEEILSHQTASDREDGSPIAAGIHDNGTSFTIPDYLSTDFTQFVHDGSCTENLTVKDSAGSVYRKQIIVHVVDTSSKVIDTTSDYIDNPGTTRFINEKYYNMNYEQGGLEENSIWKINPEYATALVEAFNNLKNNTPETTYEFTHEQILQMKEFVETYGIGNTKSPDALTRFYNQFMR